MYKAEDFICLLPDKRLDRSGSTMKAISETCEIAKSARLRRAHVRGPLYSQRNFGPFATWTNKFYNLAVTSGRRVQLAADEV